MVHHRSRRAARPSALGAATNAAESLGARLHRAWDAIIDFGHREPGLFVLLCILAVCVATLVAIGP